MVRRIAGYREFRGRIGSYFSNQDNYNNFVTVSNSHLLLFYQRKGLVALEAEPAARVPAGILSK